MVTTKSWRAWTRKEIDRLKFLRADGLLVKHIARDLGRSANSVRSRLRNEGVRWSPGRKLLEVLSQPHTLRGAARVLGTTVDALRAKKLRLRRKGFMVLRAKRSGREDLD